MPAAPVSSTIRVNRNGTSVFGRNAVIVPQQANRKSNGIVGGMLAVGYVSSNTAPMAAAGAVGVETNGKREVKRIPNGCR